MHTKRDKVVVVSCPCRACSKGVDGDFLIAFVCKTAFIDRLGIVRAQVGNEIKVEVPSYDTAWFRPENLVKINGH